MRWLLLAGSLALVGCAHEELASRPANGVDLSGEWKLNVADSDDPMRLTQAALASETAGAGPGGTTGSNGGRSNRQRGGGLGPGGPMGPPPPSVIELDEALRWPGRELAVTQTAAAVLFHSAGRDETCRPGVAPEPKRSGRAQDETHSHDAPERTRADGMPPRCGWQDDTLIVQPLDSAEEHAPYERAFTLSQDGRRLIEVVTFHGRSSGFTASRVWDRVDSAKKATQ